MYLLGCKVSDFYYLSNKGLMGMEPWDFIRWRIGELLHQRVKLGVPGRQNRSLVKNIIHNIAGEKSEDPLFRQAVLYSARLQGWANSYGSRKKQRPYLINGKSRIEGSRIGKSQIDGKSHGGSRGVVSLSTRVSNALTQEETDKFRGERRARLAQRHSTTAGYQGINVYRQQKGMGGGPCGG